MTSKAVPGHRLVEDGAPFTVDGDGNPISLMTMSGWVTPGRGLCSCGAMSEVMRAVHDRKEWFRGHKDDVIWEREGDRG